MSTHVLDIGRPADNATSSRSSRLLSQPQPLEEFCRDTEALTASRAVLEDSTARHLAAAEIVTAAVELEGTITQDGVAQIFARKYGDRLRFDHNAGA